MYYYIFSYNSRTSAHQLPALQLQHHTSAYQPLMSQSASISGAQDRWYFDALPARNAKMISITKYNGSFATSWWLCILKEKLTCQLSPGILLERADAQLKGCAIS